MPSPNPSASSSPASARPSWLRWWRPLAFLVGLTSIGGASWMVGHEAASRGDVGGSRAHASETAPEPTPQTPSVEVIRPRRGGIPRSTTQPGSVHSFESVDLLAMVSGYLKAQSVDIGSRVKRGQVLAEIDAPREARAVDEAAAMLDQARAQALQAEMRVKTTESERDVAVAAVEQSRSDVARLVARRRFAEAQFKRVEGLHRHKALPKEMVDEQQRDLDAAIAAEETGRLAVKTAEAQRATSESRVHQAQADADVARAAVEVAEARLAKAKVDLDYTRIVAPFDGVVTHRGFHPGAFIRSAPEGGQSPLLTVKRTDLMRVVVRVPDRDVVLADAGDPAVVDVDALGGRAFSGTVARVGESEDPTTRTMRLEIDLPNPEGLLREGMYGRARITLAADSPNFTVPAACVLDHTARGRGTICVVRDGKVHRAPVALGADNGSLVEILSGLDPDDAVVVRPGVPLEEGAAVVAELAPPLPSRP